MGLDLTPFEQRLARALADLEAGKPVLVADNANRENEVDAIMAAATASEQWVAWLVRHTSGYICAPMPAAVAGRLDLPPMVPANQDPLRTNYAVSVDAAHGVTTGISAADRALTLRTLGDSQSTADNLIRPGHVLPLRAHPLGIKGRPGHTEAAVELVAMAGAGEVAVIAELVHDAGRLLTFEEAQRLAAETGLQYLSIDELLANSSD